MAKVDWDVGQFQENADESPGFVLWKASTVWRRRIEAALAPLEISHPQFVAIASIAWLGRARPVTQAALGQHMNVDPNTVSQIVQVLEKRGLVLRKQLDGRSKSVELSEAGAHLFHTSLPIVEKADADFFEILGLETKILSGLLSKTVR